MIKAALKHNGLEPETARSLMVTAIASFPMFPLRKKRRSTTKESVVKLKRIVISIRPPTERSLLLLKQIPP